MVHSGYVHEERIANSLEKAALALYSDVVRIRFNVGEDWSGDSAVFFRVLLKDASSTRPRLRLVARNVAETILREVNPQELGLEAYFNFRSESEQATLKEEDWT